MILGALRTRLLTSSTLTTITNRIHPGHLPQKETLPAADMRIVTTSGNHYLGGSLGVYESIVAIDCYHDTDIEVADQLAMEVIKPGLLVGYKGTLSGVNFREILLQSGISQFEEGVDPGSDLRRFVSSVSLSVFWATDC
jgi:hypothetical protein